MKTILVPIDFSETSLNAARYAVKFARQLGCKVTLLHAFTLPPVMPLKDGLALTEEDLWEINMTELNRVALTLAPIDLLVKIDYLQLRGRLFEVVSQFEESIQTMAVVMGITGAGKVKEAIIGSNTIAVSSRTVIPVLIVPEDAVYQPVSDVGLTTDFKNVVEAIPEDKIKELINLLGAKLHVLNVDFKSRDWNNDTPFQSGLIETMFEHYHPEYHFIENSNIAEGLSDYAEKHSIELLIAIPKQHNLVDHLFSKSQTKELAFHSRVPVMIMHA